MKTLKVGCLMTSFPDFTNDRLYRSVGRNPLRISRRISRRITRQIATVAVATLACLSGVVPAASAAPGVPRFIPAKIPAGYTYSDFIDRTTPSATIRYMRYLRNGANTAAAMVVAEPGQKADWDSFARVLKNASYKTTKVKTFVAYTSTTDGVRTYYWFEKNRIMTSRSINMPVAAHAALNASVVVSKLPDASFTLKREPAGFGTVYSGSSAALVGSYSRIYWEDQQGNELTLDVSSVDRRAFEVYLLSPFVTYGTTTIKGKPAYVIEESSYVEVWWEEQPGLLVELAADDLTASALVEIADSLAPTDEATWQAFVNTPTASGSGSSGTGLGGASDAIVGAGMADGIPWTAAVGASASCLVFTISAQPAQACIKAPNSFGWNTLTVGGKTFAVGVTAANVATVVAKSSAGVELARTAVGPVSNQPVLRLFVMVLPPGTTGATVSGVDAAGVEAFPAIAAGA